MNHCQAEIKAAVKAGYWDLFSFNPALTSDGKKPFPLSRNPLAGTCPTSLTRKFPDRAAGLFAKSEAAAKARFDHLQKPVDLYK